MAGHDVRIAVVDDEEFFRDAICEILAGRGFACVTAADADAARELAASETVGVMVLDIRLPESGELDLLRELQQSHPALQVIVLSASADQETVLDALRLGACDYLAKPLHDEELVLAVTRAAGVHALAAGSSEVRAQLARLVTLCDDLVRGAAPESGDDRATYLRQAAVHGVAELLGAEKTSLMLLSDTGDALEVVAAVAPGIASEEMDSVAIGQGVAGMAFERDEALLLEGGQPEQLFPFTPVPGRYRSDSFIVVPLGIGDRGLGVLCATEALRAGGFGGEDLAVLQLFAGRLATLLAADREVKDSNAELGDTGVLFAGDVPSSADTDAELDSELVRQICDALVNDVEPERVVRAVLRPIERELGAAPVSLHLIDSATGELRCEGQLDGGSRADRAELPTSRGLTGTVLQTGHLVATRTPEMDPRYEPDIDTPEDGRPGPLLCVPLSLRGRVVGLCRIFLPEGAAASARTAEALAAVLSAAVRNVLLYRSLVESIEELAEARRLARP